MKSTLITVWKELLLIDVYFILCVEQVTIGPWVWVTQDHSFQAQAHPSLAVALFWGYTCKMAQHFCLSNIDVTSSNYWLIFIGQLL